MNFYEMRLEFDRIMRSVSDTTFESYRDDWLNRAWQTIASMFAIPSLKKTEYLDAKTDIQVYPFPLDYDGTEVNLSYRTSTSTPYYRLDPHKEEELVLAYEYRINNMGRVSYYDITHSVGSDTYILSSCGVTNKNATVTCTSVMAAMADLWLVFAPTDNGSGTVVNPGCWPYKISSVSAGVSFTLDRVFRGPSGTFTARVKPAEQQQFIVYGIPSSDITDAFALKYYAIPQRLYNDTDTPEWPNISDAIVYLAISYAYDFLHMPDASTSWFGRAMSRVATLQRRREHSGILVTDVPIGSISARSTSLPTYLSPSRSIS